MQLITIMTCALRHTIIYNTLVITLEPIPTPEFWGGGLGSTRRSRSSIWNENKSLLQDCKSSKWSLLTRYISTTEIEWLSFSTINCKESKITRGKVNYWTVIITSATVTTDPLPPPPPPRHKATSDLIMFYLHKTRRHFARCSHIDIHISLYPCLARGRHVHTLKSHCHKNFWQLLK